MKTIGIWMDIQKASIVSLHKEEELITIFSDIENYNVKGGSGTRFKGGPQDVVQDSKYLEREKHQLKVYFKKIVPYIKEVDKIVVFGPAETKDKFYKELSKNYKDISNKVKDVLPADSMTENQVKALVRAYYEKHSSQLT